MSKSKEQKDNSPQEIFLRLSTGWHLGRSKHQQQPSGISWQQHNKVQYLWPSRDFSSSNSDATHQPSQEEKLLSGNCKHQPQSDHRWHFVSSNVSHAATSMYIITDLYLHTSYLDMWYTQRDLLKKIKYHFSKSSYGFLQLFWSFKWAYLLMTTGQM